MSIEFELMKGSRAPLLTTNREDRHAATKAATKFVMRPTQFNLQVLQEAVSVFEDASVSEDEQQRFDDVVARLRSESGVVDPEDEE